MSLKLPQEVRARAEIKRKKQIELTITQKKETMDRIIFKRDQTQQKFNPQKITDAISHAMLACEEGGIEAAKNVTDNVVQKLDVKIKDNPRYIPNVEEIQDMVENELMLTNFFKQQKRIYYTETGGGKARTKYFCKTSQSKPSNTQNCMNMFLLLDTHTGFTLNSILQVISKISKPS